MEQVKIELLVPKESHELGQGAAKLILIIKKQLDDGWQTGEDLSAIMAVVIADVIPAVQGLDKMGEEWDKDPAGVIQSISMPLASAVVGMFKKEPSA